MTLRASAICAPLTALTAGALAQNAGTSAAWTPHSQITGLDVFHRGADKAWVNQTPGLKPSLDPLALVEEYDP